MSWPLEVPKPDRPAAMKLVFFLQKKTICVPKVTLPFKLCLGLYLASQHCREPGKPPAGLVSRVRRLPDSQGVGRWERA